MSPYNWVDFVSLKFGWLCLFTIGLTLFPWPSGWAGLNSALVLFGSFYNYPKPGSILIPILLVFPSSEWYGQFFLGSFLQWRWLGWSSLSSFIQWRRCDWLFLGSFFQRRWWIRSSLGSFLQWRRSDWLLLGSFLQRVLLSWTFLVQCWIGDASQTVSSVFFFPIHQSSVVVFRSSVKFRLYNPTGDCSSRLLGGIGFDWTGSKGLEEK